MQQGSGQSFCGAGCVLVSLARQAGTHGGEQDLAVHKSWAVYPVRDRVRMEWAT